MLRSKEKIPDRDDRKQSRPALFALCLLSAVIVALAALSLGRGEAGASQPKVEAENAKHSGRAEIVRDSTASGGRYLRLKRGASVTFRVKDVSSVSLRTKRGTCSATARVVVKAGGTKSYVVAPARKWKTSDHRVPAYGVATVEVSNPGPKPRRGCTKAVMVDLMSFKNRESGGVTPGVPYEFGLIGNSGENLQEQREAGIDAKVIRLSWHDFYTAEGLKNEAYITRKKEEIDLLRNSGFDIILSHGIHDAPGWVHENYENTHYVNQYGEKYTGDTFAGEGGRAIDNGEVNLVFNGEMRTLVERYTADMLDEFGTDFYAIRLGGGRWGELTYPPAKYAGEQNLYWAYDENASETNPVPGWKPGKASPNDEAGKFLDWYLQELTDYQTWQIELMRRSGYEGDLMMLYPSWGIRPGQGEAAVRGNLSGRTAAEQNGEVPRGYDFAGQVAAIEDPKVVVTTTWLDAPEAYASETNPVPVDYLAQLAAKNSVGLRLYGENTGQGDVEDLEYTLEKMREHNLIGVAWYNERELEDSRYVSLDDYSEQIARNKSMSAR